MAEDSGDSSSVEGTADAEQDGQEYLDRSKLDFDPDEGLLSGTAVDGTSDIPGPHEADGYSESGEKVELGDIDTTDKPVSEADANST